VGNATAMMKRNGPRAIGLDTKQRTKIVYFNYTQNRLVMSVMAIYRQLARLIAMLLAR
jgi:hypothetical protein